MRYLRTAGLPTVAVAVCDRCHMKKPYSLLVFDGDNPGLRVCPACADARDPYRLPARQTEDISLAHPRPEDPLT